jgi:hypothetical protein
MQKKSGRPTFLSIEDQVLLTFECRTQFHIADSWNLSKLTACRIIRKIEDILKKCPDFRLPGKKVLQTSENILEVIVVDASETVIERPKKTTKLLFGQEKAAQRKSRKWLFISRRDGFFAHAKRKAKRTISSCSNRAN